MRTVALFGGSFDPPHAAHQLGALHALETQPIDELWLVPVFVHPHGKQLAPYADRVAMCELAARALGPRVRVSRAEAELAARPGFVRSHTITLLEHLAAAHPDARFRLVIGADLLRHAAGWVRWSEVVARAPLIVVGRAGHAVPLERVAMPDISATEIRAELARRPASPHVAALLPRAVLAYIRARALYCAGSAAAGSEGA